MQTRNHGIFRCYLSHITLRKTILKQLTMVAGASQNRNRNRKSSDCWEPYFSGYFPDSRNTPTCWVKQDPARHFTGHSAKYILGWNCLNRTSLGVPKTFSFFFILQAIQIAFPLVSSSLWQRDLIRFRSLWPSTSAFLRGQIGRFSPVVI